MKNVTQRFKKIVACILATILLVNGSVAFLSANEESSSTTDKIFSGLDAILYGKNDTSQSNTGHSVSFHVDDVEGLGYIPCYGLTHDKKYTPVNDVTGSGIYRNGVIDNDIYLATFCPSGSNQMQFVISWQNTSNPTVNAGDVFRIQGQFEHQHTDGINYLLDFNETEFIWDGTDWKQIRTVTYEDLDAILYGKNDTSQSSTGYSVSFHVDNVEGLGYIPCNGLTHDKKYTPVTEVAGSGIYRNGVLDKNIYLATFYPSGSNQMQFVISWQNTSNPTVNAGDVFRIQGQFEHQHTDGTNYILDFNQTEFIWDGADWKQLRTVAYEDLDAILYGKNDTSQSNTGYSVSFHVDNVEGIGNIPCNGLTHDKKYMPVTEVTGSGIYRNGVIDENIYLATFYPSGSNQMQFVISWQNTSNPAVSEGDIFKIQGQFEHQHTDGTRYVLNFNEAEYVWNGDDWAEYVPSDEQIYEKPAQNTPEELGFTGITLKAFGIEAGPYKSSDSPNYTAGTFSGEGLDMKYLDVDISFALEEGQNIDTSLRYASANGWTGLQIGASSKGLHIQDALVGAPTTYTLEQMELQSLTETFNLKLGTKIGETYVNDTGAEVCDIAYSLWINDVLIAKDTLLTGVAQTGNQLGIYAPKGSITVSIPKDSTVTTSKGLPKDYRQLTFASFEIADGQYSYEGDQLPNVRGTTVYSLHETLFSGDVYFAGGRGADLRYGGYDSLGWTGLQFYSTQNGDIQMAGVSSKGYVTDTYKFRPFTAGTDLTDTWFNLKISIKIIDSDNDGVKDDVELGVWFNNVLYDNEYIYLKDYAQYLGDGMSTYVEAEGTYIKVKSDTSVYIGVDFTLYGFTKNWEKEIGLK